MTFIHEDPDFNDLLGIVAGWRRLPVALVEKDYWVIHVLWALHMLRRGPRRWKQFDSVNRP